MPIITLPDGNQKSFDTAVSVYQVAESIGAGLARAAIAGQINGELVDTSYMIDQNVDLAIITNKDPAGLEIIRHSTAHLLAQAVKQLFPTAQVTIGPVIEDGFYYDFAFARGFTPEDLKSIEQKMKQLAKANQIVSRKEVSRTEAIDFFRGIGEEYKAKIIEAIPSDETLSLYTQGDFTDLCRGPHVPRTGMLKAFKLTKLAGAYWRGDSNNEMLQRVYGTAWADKDALKTYLHNIEEAQKRDHRRLGKQLDLFHLQEEAPGMVFWHPRGWDLYRTVENFIREIVSHSGYREIKTPQIVDRSLWEKSGHWAMYSEEMFVTETENHVYAVKPMSCPCHVQVFNQGLKSYRDLPLRFAEFGCCHRSELSGALHGLMRVRGLTQDDGHIFCEEGQLQTEVSRFISQLFEVYKTFGFTDVILRLSTRPEKRVGSDEIWDKAESALKAALEQHGLPWEIAEGDGAFYGPKIDVSLKDCLNRIWQCGTMQVDFSMPGRLGAHYIAEDGSKQVPVMLHRAILGSLERFIGILIEHYAGAFPLWLAPIQAVVLNISEKQLDHAKNVVDRLKKGGIRAISDLRNEKIGFKIREHTLQRVPYLLVVGDREVADDAVSVRTRAGHDLGSLSITETIEKLLAEESAKRQDLSLPSGESRQVVS